MDVVYHVYKLLLHFHVPQKIKRSYSRITCSKMEENYSAFNGWSCRASQVEGLVHPSVNDEITAPR